MSLVLSIGNSKYELQSFLSPSRSIIPMGRRSDDVYNCIALDDDSVDIFQCQFSKRGEEWVVNNGQLRTECPKGIRSELQVACTMCMGRCVSLSPGKPKYSWRIPEAATLLNGKEIDPSGSVIRTGDVIKAGTLEIIVLS